MRKNTKLHLHRETVKPLENAPIAEGAGSLRGGCGTTATFITCSCEVNNTCAGPCQLT